MVSDRWIDICVLARELSRPTQPTVYYRAIVVHSSAHDKRRYKRINRSLPLDSKQLEKDCKKATVIVYLYREDIQAAGEKRIRQAGFSYPQIQIDLEEVPTISYGRANIDKPKLILRYEYMLTAAVSEATKK
ncbi:MAG: hypothetical protein WAU91_08705 [Desulfatitalea sp.]